MLFDNGWRSWAGAIRGALLYPLTACAAVPQPSQGETPARPLAAISVPVTPVKRGDARSELPAGTLVELRRGPCFGRCPQYSVTIDVTGLVRFDGERHVAALGPQLGQADPRSLTILMTRLRDPELLRARDVYRPDGVGCGPVTTDMPTSEIRWRVEGVTRQLRLYQGCSAMPDFIATLPSAIDAAAGSDVWVRQGAVR